MERAHWEIRGLQGSPAPRVQPNTQSQSRVGPRQLVGGGRWNADGDDSNNKLLLFSTAFLQGQSWSEVRAWNKMCSLPLGSPKGARGSFYAPTALSIQPRMGGEGTIIRKSFPRLVKLIPQDEQGAARNRTGPAPDRGHRVCKGPERRWPGAPSRVPGRLEGAVEACQHSGDGWPCVSHSLPWAGPLGKAGESQPPP